MQTTKKEKLKKLLATLSTDDEKGEMAKLDSIKVKDIVSHFEEEIEESEANYDKLLFAFTKFATTSQKHSQVMQEGFSTFAETLAKKLDETGGKITSGYEKHKPKDLSGFFKDFSVLIEQGNKYSKDTSELIRNLKWNASQQIRDSNGSPIDPSIAPFGITKHYDDIQLTYSGSNISTVSYFANNVLLATLTLTYSGSNLTEVKRTV